MSEENKINLWAVHVEGPDDIHACIDKKHAEKMADEINESISEGKEKTTSDLIPYCHAEVIESPFSELEHWKYLAEQMYDESTELRASLNISISQSRNYKKNYDLLSSQIKAAQEQVPVASKEVGRWVGLESLHSMPNGSRLYAVPVPADHIADERNMVNAAPAVATPLGYVQKHHYDSAQGGKLKGQAIVNPDISGRELVELVPVFWSPPSPRISEHDARQIVGAFVPYWDSLDIACTVDESFDFWIETDEFKELMLPLQSNYIPGTGKVGDSESNVVAVIPEFCIEDCFLSFRDDIEFGRDEQVSKKLGEPVENHISEAGKMINVWQGIDSAPLDGTPIVVNLETTFRYLPYRKGSNQLKNGIKGRWQVYNGYGWDNCETPVGEWRSALVNHSVDANKKVPGTLCPEDHTPVSNEMIDFLHGKSEFKNCNFGEEARVGHGRFWWRKYLPRGGAQ